MNTSRTKNYILAVFSGYISTTIVTLIGFWLTPFSLSYLSRSEYGIFLILADIMTWLGLFDIGLSAVLNYKAAKLSARPKQKLLNIMVNTVFFTQLAVALILLIVGWILIRNYTIFFHVEEQLRNEIGTIMGLFLLATVIRFVSKVFSSLLVAHQQAHIDNMVKVSAALARTAVVVVMLIHGYGLYALVFGSLTGALFTSILTVWRAYHLFPRLQLSIRYYSLRLIKEYYGLGFWFLINGISGIGIETIDRLITAKFLGSDMVTTLVLTGRLYLLTSVLVGVLANASRPMVGQLLGAGKRERAEEVLESLKRMSVGFAILFTATVFAGNKAFVTAWVGKDNYGSFFLESGIILLIVMKIWLLPYRILTSSALHRIREVALSRLLNMVFFAIVAYWIGWRYGLNGVVYSGVVAMMVTSFWFLPGISAKYFNHSFFYYLAQDFLHFTPFAALLYLSAFVIRMTVASSLSGFSAAFVSFCIMGIVGLTVWWYWMLDHHAKEKILSKIKKVGRG